MTAPLDDAEDRAIARALDADDAASLVTGVGSADGDMSATDEYREALSYLPFAEVEPAPELEDRVLAAALARRPAAVPALERVARRRSRARRVTLAGTAVAGAAVISLLVGTADRPERALRGRIEEIADSVTSIVEEPGTRTATLTAADRESVGTAVLTTDGDGVLYDLALPTPASSQVLWVWLVTPGEHVRLGPVADPDTRSIGFTVTGDTDAVKGIAVSAEPAGITPSAPGQVVAAGPF
ncbi:MAG: anti-sigma factor [Acidimicrobiia bacterium]